MNECMNGILVDVSYWRAFMEIRVKGNAVQLPAATRNSINFWASLPKIIIIIIIEQIRLYSRSLKQPTFHKSILTITIKQISPFVHVHVHSLHSQSYSFTFAHPLILFLFPPKKKIQIHEKILIKIFVFSL